MLIGVGLDARLGLPFDRLRAAAREARQLGFESLWTPAGGLPDSFHVCAAWLRDTSLRTGIAVVPAARMWTPPGLAAQAATLAQLSSGRFVLGLGTGGYGPGFWASVGLPDRPIAVMREYVTQVRALLAGAEITAGQGALGQGAPGWPRLPELAAAPDHMLRAVGYYGPAAAAPAAFARLSTGLDEAIVRIITARPGPEPVSEAMAAQAPPAPIRSSVSAGVDRCSALTRGPWPPRRP